MIYLEVEMGNHEKPALRAKIQTYQKTYRDKREQFCVLFAVPTEEAAHEMIELFAETNATSHYWVVVQNEFIASPLEAQISNQNSTFTL